MPVERRGQVTGIEVVRVNGKPEELDDLDGRRQPLVGGMSRISREAYVRFCERLGVQFPGPTRQALANDVGAQLICGGLEGGDVVDCHKGVVVLAEADLAVSELMLDEVVAVEVVCGSEGEERGHTHHDRAEDFVVDVEIVVGEATPLVGEDAIVGVFGGIFRHGDAEGRAASMLLKMKYTP